MICTKFKKSDKTASRESDQNRMVSMSVAKIHGKMKFEGSIGLSGSYPVYIQWICLKFCMKDRSGVLMICTKFKKSDNTVSREN